MSEAGFFVFGCTCLWSFSTTSEKTLSVDLWRLLTCVGRYRSRDASTLLGSRRRHRGIASTPSSHQGQVQVHFMTLSQHRDARGQPRKVGVLGSHVGRRLGGELVELVGRDAVVDALDDLLGQDLRRAYCDENALAWSCDHDRLVETPSRRPRHKFKFISRSDVARSA